MRKIYRVVLDNDAVVVLSARNEKHIKEICEDRGLSMSYAYRLWQNNKRQAKMEPIK